MRARSRATSEQTNLTNKDFRFFRPKKPKISTQTNTSNELETCHELERSTITQAGGRQRRGSKPPSERSERRPRRQQQRTRTLSEFQQPISRTLPQLPSNNTSNELGSCDRQMTI